MAEDKSTQINVTPEMLRAGLEVLEESGRLSTDYLVSADKLLVAELFLAMWQHHVVDS